LVAAELKVGFIDGSQCHLEPRTWAEAKLSQKTMLPTLIAVAAACRYSVDSHRERLTKQQKRATIEERGSETILEKRDDLFPAIRLMRTPTDSCGCSMPVLSGQSLGKAYQATEARNHRGVRIRDHLGKGRRPIPGYQTHENRELRTTGNARSNGTNFFV
jgi:hypothetical protein